MHSVECSMRFRIVGTFLIVKDGCQIPNVFIDRPIFLNEVVSCCLFHEFLSHCFVRGDAILFHERRQNLVKEYLHFLVVSRLDLTWEKLTNLCAFDPLLNAMKSAFLTQVPSKERSGAALELHCVHAELMETNISLFSFYFCEIVVELALRLLCIAH